uniref:Uncharacterized protein n=4 Tax=Schistocephalus solidus TaxID=70667 RepID=A0A0X3PRS3_SCHSO
MITLGCIFVPIFAVVLIWQERYRADFLTFVELSNLISLQSVFCHRLFQNGPLSTKNELPYRLSVLTFTTTSIMLQALRTNIFIYLSQNVVLALLTFLEIVLFLSFGSALSAPTEDIAPSCATVSPAFGLVITLILGWHHLSNRLESILLKPSRFLWLMALSVISCLATLGALSLLHAKKQAYFSLAVGILFTCTHLTDVILYYALISPPVVSLCHSGVSVLLAYTLHHRLGRVAKVKLFWPITTFGLLVPGFSKTLFVCLDMIMTTSGALPWSDQLRTATTTSNSHSATSLARLLLLSSPRRVPHAPEVVGCLMFFAGLLSAFRVVSRVASSTTGPLPAAVRASPEARVWVVIVLTFLWFYLSTRLFLVGVIQMVWMLIFGRPLDIPSPIFALLWTIIALYQPNAMNLPTPFPKALIADSFDDGGVVDGEANPWHGLRSKADLDVGYLITCLRLFCLVCALPLVSHFAVSFTSYTALLLYSYVLFPVCAFLTLSLPLRVTTTLCARPSFPVNLTRPSIVLRVMAVSFACFLLLRPLLVVDLFTSLLVVCVTGSLIGIYYASASVSNLSPRLGVGEGERTMYLNDVASLILCYACVTQSSILLLLALVSNQLRSPIMWCFGLGSIFFISQYARWFSSHAFFTKRNQSTYFDWRIVVYVNISVSLTFLALCFNSLSWVDQPQVYFIPLVLCGLCGRCLEGPRRIVPTLLAFTLLSFASAFLQLCFFNPLFNWRSAFELFLLLALLPLYLSLVLNRLQLNLCKRQPKSRLAVGFRQYCDLSSLLLMPLCIFCSFLTSSLTSTVYQGTGVVLCFAHIQSSGLDF